MTTVKSLGPLDWDDYDNLEEVIGWLVTVITFDLFEEPQDDIGESITASAPQADTCIHLHHMCIVVCSVMI